MKASRSLKKIDKNKESGSSILEVIPLIMVMAGLLGFLLAFWGMNHKHILHSIAARNYAFETFRNRSNLMYFGIGGESHSYESSLLRFHGIGVSTPDDFTTLSVPIKFPASQVVRAGDSAFHQTRLWEPDFVVEGVEIPVNRAPQGMTHAWVMVGYGICLNADCGG